MIFIQRIKKSIQIRMYAPHFLQIYKQSGDRKFTLLDVGCGPNSVQIYSTIFPLIEYQGIDYNNNGITDLVKQRMHRFYDINLDMADLSQIPDDYFDYIVISHVLEHLHDPYHLIRAVAGKLKINGNLYIEYPSKKSKNVISANKLPFVKGTLNFYDDPTHIEVCDSDKVIRILRENGFSILKNKLRRNFFYMIFGFPVILIRFVKNHYMIKASDLWDFVGFAQIVYARKSKTV